MYRGTGVIGQGVELVTTSRSICVDTSPLFLTLVAGSTVPVAGSTVQYCTAGAQLNRTSILFTDRRRSLN